MSQQRSSTNYERIPLFPKEGALRGGRLTSHNVKVSNINLNLLEAKVIFGKIPFVSYNQKESPPSFGYVFLFPTRYPRCSNETGVFTHI